MIEHKVEQKIIADFISIVRMDSPAFTVITCKDINLEKLTLRAQNIVEANNLNELVASTL